MYNFAGVPVARFGKEPEVPPPVDIPDPKPYVQPPRRKSPIPARQKTPDPVPTAPVRVSHKPKREPSLPKEDTSRSTPELTAKPPKEARPALTLSPTARKTPTPTPTPTTGSKRDIKREEKTPTPPASAR